MLLSALVCACCSVRYFDARSGFGVKVVPLLRSEPRQYPYSRFPISLTTTNRTLGGFSVLFCVERSLCSLYLTVSLFMLWVC